MGQVPTASINALYTNTTDGITASPTIMDAAIQDIVATINTNDSTLIPTAKIALLAITTALLADGSVTSAKILDGTITTGDIADLAITVAKIADGAITSAKILDGTIMNADINAVAAIDAAKIGTGTVSNAEFGYLDGVTGPIQQQLTNATLGAIADGSITDVKLDNGATSVKAKANAAAPKDSPQFIGLVKSTNNTFDDGTGLATLKGLALGTDNAPFTNLGFIIKSIGNFYVANHANTVGLFSLDDAGNTTILGSLTTGAGGSFANSKNANGYQKLPGGLIMQWGVIFVSGTFPDVSNGSTSYTFPIAFPNACSVVIAMHNSSSTVFIVNAQASSVTSTIIYFRNMSGAAVVNPSFNWIAIGY